MERMFALHDAVNHVHQAGIPGGAQRRERLRGAQSGHTLAVCGPAVVRAAVVAVLDAPNAAFWRVDISPLTATDLRGGPDRWTVRATGVPLRSGRRGT